MKVDTQMPPPAEFVITLTLSRREALALKTIIGKVTGDETGPRSVTLAFYDELNKLVPTNTLELASGQIDMPDTWEIFEGR